MFFRKRRAHKRELEKLNTQMLSVSPIEEKIKELREKAEDRRYMSYVNGEQGTKNALIEPFLRALGFDPSDARAVRLEYQIGSGRVDYALFLPEQPGPVFLVEAKKHGKNLSKYGKRFFKQIGKYFNGAPPARLILLTNGKELRFYANDFDSSITGSGHKLSERPFLRINILSPRANYIHDLECFCSDNFKPEEAPHYSEKLKMEALGHIKQALQAGDDPSLLSGIRSCVGLTADVIDDATLSEIIRRTSPKRRK